MCTTSHHICLMTGTDDIFMIKIKYVTESVDLNWIS